MSEEITRIDDVEKLLSDGWKRNNCIFRGQAKDYPLIPKIGRDNGDRSISDLESDILTLLKKGYREMHQSSKNHSDFNVDPNNLSEWDWHVLAQHHGLPTRLLDWSVDFKVALYFAVTDANDPERDSDGALYVFQDPAAIIRRKTGWGGIKTVRRFRACSHPDFNYIRVKRQRSELTFLPNPQIDMFDQLGHDPRQKWAKFIIRNSTKAKLKNDLCKQGITHSWLFPGLDGLCEEIRYELEL